MTDLRKAAEMALEALEEINKLSVGEKAVCLPAEIDCAMETLRQALAAQPRKETFTLDRGCWERGCMAYDERDGDGVTISAKRIKKKNT